VRGRRRGGLSRAGFLHALVAQGTVGNEILAAVVADVTFLGWIALVVNHWAALIHAFVARGAVGNEILAAGGTHVTGLGGVALVRACRNSGVLVKREGEKEQHPRIRDE
jgi:hypothetical protein